MDILIALEDPIWAFELGTALQAGGQIVQVVNSGSHAQLLVDRMNFHAIVLGQKLSGVSGLQVASVARLSTINRRSLIYMVSGGWESSLQERARKIGVNDLIYSQQTPPLDLSQRILNHLKARQASVGSYDIRLINAVVEATSSAFELFLGVPPLISKPYARETYQASKAFMSTVVNFTGLRLKGSLAVAVTPGFLFALSKRVYPGVPLHEEIFADITSELSNQVMGRTQGLLEELGLRVEIQEPTIYVGSQQTILHKVEAPILCLDIGRETVGSSVEFCFVPD